jgi:prevent-host-death family protein
MFLVIIVVMIKANIAQVKENLSKYVALAEEGETVMICKRNEPVAQLVAVEKKRRGRVKLGTLKGKIEILPGAFDPLTDEELKDWYGE